ncbi:MAG: GFA family protein [Thermoleophilaceae bacterium]|nr:GFA family protein [Thermoleophilaceae bacterium]
MAVTGRCLCGAVRFEVDGPLRDVVVCHCGECRRWAGHVWASTSAPRDALLVSEQSALRWIDSPESETHARRGFCSDCGSSLFWEAPGRDTISIAAGALDPPTGLRTTREIYTEFAGDYYRPGG